MAMTSSPLPESCETLCAGEPDGAHLGSLCSNHYCYCTAGQGFNMSCDGGAAGFCPSSGPFDWGYGDCIADCEAACHTRSGHRVGGQTYTMIILQWDAAHE